MKVKDNNNIISIDINVINTMRRYIQNDKREVESGGVLIGKENLSNSDIIIKYITEPHNDDKRTKSLFLRKDEQHIKEFQKIYKESGGIYRYIGEWHTHSEDVPMYSSIDLTNWELINSKAPNGISHYHIIIGVKAFGIWKYNARMKAPKNMTTIFWEEKTHGKI